MGERKTLKRWVRDELAAGRSVPGVVVVLSALPESKTEVRVVGEELALVIWQGAQWAVTEYGVEARDGLYYIPAARLNEEIDKGRSFVRHMAEKEWVDIREFALAFVIACAVFKVHLPAYEG